LNTYSLWAAGAFYARLCPIEENTDDTSGIPQILKKAIQDGLLSTYRFLRRRGAFDGPLGRWLFLSAYRTYKTLWEPDIGFLRQFVRPDDWIVDIGANVGFFSKQFCEWVAGSGRVLAFEPEHENFRFLQQMATKPGADGVLLARQCLVADVDTTLQLVLNPDNPADHRIGANGIPTPAVRLDTVFRSLVWPPVGLLKIDVQGAESLVLRGAQETLERSHPAIFIEIDESALHQFGSSPKEIEQQLSRLGYQMYEASATTLGAPLDASRAKAIRSRLGYADFVFLARD
jgi:FkbM family methyltransferase